MERLGDGFFSGFFLHGCLTKRFLPGLAIAGHNLEWLSVLGADVAPIHLAFVGGEA